MNLAGLLLAAALSGCVASTNPIGPPRRPSGSRACWASGPPTAAATAWEFVHILARRRQEASGYPGRQSRGEDLGRVRRLCHRRGRAAVPQPAHRRRRRRPHGRWRNTGRGRTIPMASPPSPSRATSPEDRLCGEVLPRRSRNQLAGETRGDWDVFISAPSATSRPSSAPPTMRCCSPSRFITSALAALTRRARNSRIRQSFGDAARPTVVPQSSRYIDRHVSKRPRPVILCILDGWGERHDRPQRHPAGPYARMGRLHARLPPWPDRRLGTACRPAGRPDGQLRGRPHEHRRRPGGDAGPAAHRRRHRQGEIARNPALQDFIAKLKASGGTCHLMGLMSPGGVHSHQDHIAALARILDGAGVPVAIHAFLDGRDTPPSSARGFLAASERRIAGLRGPDRHNRRPLLRHGPRQAVGAGRAGLRRPGGRQGRARGRRTDRHRCGYSPRRDRRIRQAHRRRRLSRHEGRRRRADGQFPRRPRAPDPGGAAGSGVHGFPRPRIVKFAAAAGHERIFDRARTHSWPPLFPPNG